MTPLRRSRLTAKPAPAAQEQQWRGQSYSYPCPELYVPPGRPHSLDAFQLPSRMGTNLHYRDGRVTDLHGRTVSK